MKTSVFSISNVALATFLVSGAVCAQTSATADAASAAGRRPDAAARPAPPAAETGTATTLTGRVARWLPNPNGEVDGFLLDDGTRVDFPPHLSARVLAATKVGDSVRVTGNGSPTQQTPAVLRAKQIRSSGSGQTVVDEPPAGSPPPAPRDHAALAAMKEGGRIATLLRTGRGDVDGVVFDSGTVVRFPPHVGTQFATLLKPSATLYAVGYGTRNAQGSAFEATQMGASEAAVQTVFPGPHGPGGPGAKPPAPGAGPGAGPGPDGPRPPAPRAPASAPR